jgi:hypothetical protein
MLLVKRWLVTLKKRDSCRASSFGYLSGCTNGQASHSRKVTKSKRGNLENLLKRISQNKFTKTLEIIDMTVKIRWTS